MSDHETLSVYPAQANEYASVTSNLAGDPLLAAFITSVKPGGEVLDLGCGPGIAAAEMARAGLNVTAMDPVAEMVALAAQNANITTKIGSFDDLKEVDCYDGIWANFSLLHAPRADMPRHLSNIARALHPGGIFHIGVKLGTGEKRDRIGRLYTYFTEDELVTLLTHAGLNVTDRKKGRDKGLDGTEADWVCLRAWRS